MRCLQSFTKLNLWNTPFLSCDVQENFRNGMPLFAKLAKNTSKLTRIGNTFKIALIGTEQYLGHTVKKLPIKDAVSVTPDVLRHIKKGAQEKGIDPHVCVLQTSTNFTAGDYKKNVMSDRAPASNLMRPIFGHLKNELRSTLANMCLVTTKDMKQNVSPQKWYDSNSKEKKISSKAVKMRLIKKKDSKKKEPKKRDIKKKSNNKSLDLECERMPKKKDVPCPVLDPVEPMKKK